ncbi:MAG: hypothetical protein CBD16_04420 [Betaproteobacteria bacterium TMED156]|nr:MAG: hypothetical protein CBD16_04420 [Betaproteobacteria bacterium TMED156]|tara:strand:- start:218 stop:802 length:585 start_codon:yes stop_codon:yes gene_type:complete
MAFILTSLTRTIAAGLILLILIAFIFGDVDISEPAWIAFFFRWLHVIAGVMWIGLLWYFNFVQIPSMPKIPDEQKPAISKVIAPEALFWFRYSALATVVTGLIVAWINGYGHQALMISDGFVAIGIGMWLAIIMAINVWFIIWPNQKKALGMIQVDQDQKVKAAKLAMLTSRINTLLSFPMLYLMVAQQNVGLG